MKMNKNKILYVVYGILFILFILNLISEIKSFIHHHYLIWPGTEYSLDTIKHTLALTSDFTIFIFSIPFAVGLFLKNRTGWILIISYVYYLLINCIFQNYGSRNWDAILFCLSILLICIGLIFFMSKSITVLGYHNIKKVNKLELNFIAFLFGLLMSFSLLLYKEYVLPSWI